MLLHRRFIEVTILHSIMAPAIQVRSEVVDTLHESDARVLSAQNVADTLGYSRQYIDRILRELADSDDRVGRVEIGPSVGYYWRDNELQQMDQSFEERKLTGGYGRSMPVVCNRCESVVSPGDELVSVFERVQSDWEVHTVVCADCVSEQPGQLIQSLLPPEYVSSAAEEQLLDFAAVRGTLQKRTYEYDEKPNVEASVLTETTVQQLVRNRGDV